MEHHHGCRSSINTRTVDSCKAPRANIVVILTGKPFIAIMIFTCSIIHRKTSPISVRFHGSPVLLDRLFFRTSSMTGKDCDVPARLRKNCRQNAGISVNLNRVMGMHPRLLGLNTAFLSSLLTLHTWKASAVQVRGS